MKEAYCIQSNDERGSLHAKRTMRYPARVWLASAGSLAWALLCLAGALPGRCFAWPLLCLALLSLALFSLALFSLALFSLALFSLALFCLALFCLALFCLALFCLALHRIEEACWHRAAEALDALNAK